jgi:hypothetical protein
MARVRERAGDRETAAPGPDHRNRARPAWMTKCGTAHLCPLASMAVMLAAADCTVRVPVAGFIPLNVMACANGLALIGFRGDGERGDGERAQATSASIKEPSSAFPRLRAL